MDYSHCPTITEIVHDLKLVDHGEGGALRLPKPALLKARLKGFQGISSRRIDKKL